MIGKVFDCDFGLNDLLDQFDVVFLFVGLGGVNVMCIEGEELVIDVVKFIVELCQVDDLIILLVG